MEALSCVIICWSALCSMLAPDENSLLNYVLFGFMVGGACILVILFVVVRRSPLHICLSSCCSRDSCCRSRSIAALKSRKTKTFSKAKKDKRASSVPLDILAPQDDTSVLISSCPYVSLSSEPDYQDENECIIHYESEDRFDEEKKADR